jgi:hypothetical protein
LPGKEHQRRFQYGEGQRQKWNRDQSEFYGGGAILVPCESARGARRQQPVDAGGNLTSNAIKHGNLRDH